MKQLIETLIDKADLNSDQAEKVAGVVKDFLADKLPAALKGPVLGALSGDTVESAADQAKGLLGKLF